MTPHAITNRENEGKTGMLPVALRLFSWEKMRVWLAQKSGHYLRWGGNAKVVVRLGASAISWQSNGLERCGQTGRKGWERIASNGDKAGLVCHARKGRIQLPRREAGLPSSRREEGNGPPSSYSQLWCRFVIHRENRPSEYLGARRSVDGGK
jgi:hypothetical protein